MRWPVERPAFGRAFGWRIHPTRHVRQFHQGQDFPNSSGTPLVAIADGVVYTAATVRQNPGGGNFIGIRFADGSRARYFHMRDAPRLKAGDPVREGDIVGYLGNTGTWTTGPHLHFEISDHKGVAQDPRVFIASRLTESLGHPVSPVEPAGPAEEDTLSAAEVTEIKNHIDESEKRLLAKIEEESRGRVYVVTDGDIKGRVYIVHLSTGVYMHIGSTSQLESIAVSGYKYAAPGSLTAPTPVTAVVLRNILKDCDAARKALGGR